MDIERSGKSGYEAVLFAGLLKGFAILCEPVRNTVIRHRWSASASADTTSTARMHDIFCSVRPKEFGPKYLVREDQGGGCSIFDDVRGSDGILILKFKVKIWIIHIHKCSESFENLTF